MKNLLIILLFGVLSLGTTLNNDKGLARVERVGGYYVFAMADPIAEYEVLGIVKGRTVGSHEFDKLLSQVIKKAQKEYPDANGILFDGPIKQSHNTKVSIIKIE